MNRPRDPLSQHDRHPGHDGDADDRDSQECEEASPAAVPERTLQGAYIEHADGLVPDVLYRAVSRDVPVVDHEGSTAPGVSIPEYVVGNLSRSACRDGPCAVRVQHIGGDPDIVLEYGRRSNLPPFVQDLPEDDLADSVYDLVIPVDQYRAVQHSLQAAVRREHGSGRPDHHPGGFTGLPGGRGHRRRRKLHLCLHYQLGGFLCELILAHDGGIRDRHPLTQHAADQLVAGQAVTV